MGDLAEPGDMDVSSCSRNPRGERLEVQTGPESSDLPTSTSSGTTPLGRSRAFPWCRRQVFRAMCLSQVDSTRGSTASEKTVKDHRFADLTAQCGRVALTADTRVPRAMRGGWAGTNRSTRFSSGRRKLPEHSPPRAHRDRTTDTAANTVAAKGSGSNRRDSRSAGSTRPSSGDLSGRRTAPHTPSRQCETSRRRAVHARTPDQGQGYRQPAC